MTRVHIPQAVLDAAHARSAARAAREWDEADRLRAEIEAAGWIIVDRGTDFALSPAVAPDVLDGERTRYGSSASVPDGWATPEVGPATIVMVVSDAGDRLEATVAAIRAASPDGVSVVVVADDPSPDALDALERLEADAATEVVWTFDRLGVAAGLNIGIRRASGPVVIWLDPATTPSGDLVSPLVAALDDPTVALAGAWGTTSADLRRFEPAPSGNVDAIEVGCMAFRRADAIERGPIDEAFRSPAQLAIWWSLTLRDSGEDAAPRRALALADVPVARPAAGPATTDSEPAMDPSGDRAARRDRYRIIDRFGWRRDLLVGG